MSNVLSQHKFIKSINNRLAIKLLGIKLNIDIPSEKLGFLLYKYSNSNCKCHEV